MMFGLETLEEISTARTIKALPQTMTDGTLTLRKWETSISPQRLITLLELQAKRNSPTSVTLRVFFYLLKFLLGTTQMFYGLSHNEAFFADRVSVFVALGPVMQLTHCKSSLIHFFADFRSLIVDTAGTLGFYEFFPAGYLTTGAMRLLCGTIPQLCNFGLYLLTDEDPTVNDPDRTPVYLGHFPSGTSLRSIDHYGQILSSQKFQRMDYGSTKNKQVYGQTTPPLIDLHKIQKVPIGLFVGTSDQLATVDDNRWAKTQLATLKFYKEYSLGHLSFMIGRDMSYFSVDVMNLLKQYHPVKLEEATFLE